MFAKSLCSTSLFFTMKTAYEEARKVSENVVGFRCNAICIVFVDELFCLKRNDTIWK